MTTKRILHQNADGSVAVTWPNPKARREGESEGDFLRRVIARLIETSAQLTDDGHVFAPHITQATEFKIVEASEVPAERAARVDLFRSTPKAIPPQAKAE